MTAAMFGPIGMAAGLRGMAARIGLTGLAIAALMAFLAVQTVRLEGLKFWPLAIDGWKSRALTTEKTLNDIALAQRLAAERARAERVAREATYRAIAERIDDNAREDLDDAMAAAERFIAAGGVRTETARCPRGRAGTGPENHSAGDAQGAGQAAELDAAPNENEPGPLIPDGFVLVPADDVRICTTNTVKAEAGRSLALELEAASGEKVSGN